jgi:GTP cyclohydrolase I
VLAFDRPRLERAVREMLLAIGEDLAREGLAETPARVARAQELFRRPCRGSGHSPARTFEQESEAL